MVACFEKNADNQDKLIFMEMKDVDFKKMYDYETNFHLTMNSERLAKLICHYEIFKKVNNKISNVVRIIFSRILKF